MSFPKPSHCRDGADTTSCWCKVGRRWGVVFGVTGARALVTDAGGLDYFGDEFGHGEFDVKFDEVGERVEEDITM